MRTMWNTEKTHRGIVIAEGLEEPSLINDFRRTVRH
jgi:hypothetical protein